MSILFLKKNKKTFLIFHLTNLLFCGIIKTMKEEVLPMKKIINFYRKNRLEINTIIVLLMVFAAGVVIGNIVQM